MYIHYYYCPHDCTPMKTAAEKQKKKAAYERKNSIQTRTKKKNTFRLAFVRVNNKMQLLLAVKGSETFLEL